jgi:hypothetical protein
MLDDEPPSPGQWSDGTTELLPGRVRRRGGDDADGEGEAGPRRLPVLLLFLVLLAAGAYLVWSQLLNNDSDDTTAAPPVRPSTVASAAASPSAATPMRTLGAAELAASLQDGHFKHGYDWAKQHGAVAADQREQTCRDEALRQRQEGYPWGAHDRAGCLIGLAG